MSKEVVAYCFWTRDEKNVIKWTHILVNSCVKFSMSAYNEGQYTRQYVYVFRLENPCPDQEVIDKLKSKGLDHSYVVYKEAEESAVLKEEKIYSND